MPHTHKCKTIKTIGNSNTSKISNTNFIIKALVVLLVLIKNIFSKLDIREWDSLNHIWQVDTRTHLWGDLLANTMEASLIKVGNINSNSMQCKDTGTGNNSQWTKIYTGLPILQMSYLNFRTRALILLLNKKWKSTNNYRRNSSRPWPASHLKRPLPF